MWDEKDILRIKTFAGFLTNDEECVIWKDNCRGKLSLKIRVKYFQLNPNVIYIITYRELDKEKEYYVICSTGHRSSLSISILLKKGFYHLVNVAGGMTGMGAFWENREIIKK